MGIGGIRVGMMAMQGNQGGKNGNVGNQGGNAGIRVGIRGIRLRIFVQRRIDELSLWRGIKIKGNKNKNIALTLWCEK